MIPVGGGTEQSNEIRFHGRSRAETKRKALAWWVANRDDLKLSMAEFLASCSITADGTAIVYRKPEPKKESAVRSWVKLFSRA